MKLPAFTQALVILTRWKGYVKGLTLLADTLGVSLAALVNTFAPLPAVRPIDRIAPTYPKLLLCAPNNLEL